MKPAGAVLLRQGDPPDAVWYVKHGTVLVSSSTESGDETSCALRGPGALLGIEAYGGRPVEYEAWALSDVVVCRIGADAFRAWVGEPGTPGGAVLQLALVESERRQRERAALSGSVVQRLARFLLARRELEGDRPLCVEQRVLARMLGMRAETLSRALASLRAAGAIGRRNLVVRDVGALVRLSEEE